MVNIIFNMEIYDDHTKVNDLINELQNIKKLKETDFYFDYKYSNENYDYEVRGRDEKYATYYIRKEVKREAK
jgi:hypothetical protein